MRQKLIAFVFNLTIFLSIHGYAQERAINPVFRKYNKIIENSVEEGNDNDDVPQWKKDADATVAAAKESTGHDTYYVYRPQPRIKRRKNYAVSYIQGLKVYRIYVGN